MRVASEVTFYLGYFLLGVAFLNAVTRAAARRDRHRLDTAFFVALLLIIPLVRQPRNTFGYGINVGLIFLLPYGLLRLVRHFRDVARWLPNLALLIAAVFIVVPILPGTSAPVLLGLGAFYRGGLFAIIAVMLSGDARRSSGVKARRITLAAVATGLVAFATLLAAVATWHLRLALGVDHSIQFLEGVGLICYFFAFAPPRFLLGRWQRAERAEYLATVAEREPEERGQRAADDLFWSALRGVGGAATLVALRGRESDDRLIVRIASDSALAGREISVRSGLIGRALETRTAQCGVPADLGHALAGWFTPQAVQVIVAPVVASHVWGVVLAVHRRGALFPEDDVALLTQLGRDAATALDHAALIDERRDLARQAADRRLREIELRMSLMLDSIKDFAMLLLDEEGRVAAWHHGAQHLFGFREDQISDQPGSTLYDVPAADFAAWLAAARTHGFIERESRCRRRDGTTFIGLTVVRPLVNEPGTPPGFVAVTRDVTERRALEDRVRQGQKMEAIGHLAGGIAHDFNNLLSAILGYAEFLDNDLADNARGRDQVEAIQKAADRGADLTRQLLAFSRREPTRPVSVNLSDLVANLLPMLRRLVPDSIEIVNHASPTLSSVLGDPGQLERVIVNLVVNARDAMPGGGRVTIRTSDVWLEREDSIDRGQPDEPAPLQGPHVLLEVADTGIGMDADTRRRAFEPFFTTKEVGKGTGLGLSTVYGIVKQMGGAIDVDSAPGQGATFRVHLPRSSETAAIGAALRQGETGPANEAVLVVERDDEARSYLGQILEADGYTVVYAEDSDGARKIVQSFPGHIKLVISERPGVPALCFSIGAEAALARDASPEPRDVLPRPFSSAELLERVRQILSAA